MTTWRRWNLIISTTEESEGRRPDLLTKIQDMGRALSLSEDTVRRAEDIVEHHRSDFKVNEEYLPAAAVHLASRVEEEPRSQKMIVDYLEDDDELFTSQGDRRKRKINEVVKKLKRQMDLDLELVRSEEYLQYIVSQLDVVNVDEDVIEAARKYCRAVEGKKGVARSKVAIAGTCLKVALGERDDCDSVSNRDLADATAMNRTTFQNNLDYFREKGLLEN